MQFHKIQLQLLFILFSLLGVAQQLPPIVKYSKDVYGAGIQNWMISQDNHRFMYFANNEGLLEFNGSKWILNPSPNETIIRSVKCINDKIYTGSFMEFGYWQRAINGQLSYTSLSNSIKDKINDDEQFWGIFPFDNWILFQSLEKIYAYNTKTKLFTVIDPKSTINKVFKTTNGIYFQTTKGLYEIDQGKSKLFLSNEIINQNKLINIFDTNDGLILVTQKQGIFKYQNAILTKFITNVDAEIQQSNIYSSQMLSDESIALGSISNGIFILSKEGKLIYHITQNSGLSNNTALSLFEDIDKNLWIGLDNGINCINLKSPIKSYLDNTGILGTTYASITHNNKLYIGTNQGLFCKDLNSTSKFEFVQNTKGQVWNLFSYQNTLFCGHDSGTFIINDKNATPIFAASGTWKFVPFGNTNYILQGNYNGITVLEKKNNTWVYKNKIKGFNYSSKHFEILNTNEIYVSHEYKGVYKFKVDNSLLNASDIIKFDNLTKSKNATLAKYNNQIYYASKDGIFKMNNATKIFEKDKSLSAIFQNDEYVTGKMIVDKSNKLWFFTKNYIHYYSSGKLSPELKKNSLPIPSSLTNSMPGYENILQLGDETYLIGTTDGYYVLKNNEFKFSNHKVSLFGISNNVINSKSTNISLTEKGAATTVQALEAGAAGIFTKPQLGVKDFLINSKASFADAIREVAKINTKNLKHLPKAPAAAIPMPLPEPAAMAMAKTTEKVIAIGTSTGGTIALEYVLSRLDTDCEGIVIVQHMPEKFTAAFAERLNTLCAIEVREAKHGDRVRPGLALIAPGGQHMSLMRNGAYYHVSVKPGPAVNRHCPSVDVLFRSVAKIAGTNSIGIIMTGMGDDGAASCRLIKQVGGKAWAQSPDDCTSDSMPVSALSTGCVSLNGTPEYLARSLAQLKR